MPSLSSYLTYGDFFLPFTILDPCFSTWRISSDLDSTKTTLRTGKKIILIFYRETDIRYKILNLYIFFCVGIWSLAADKLHFILSYEAGFYKPTVLKVHPPFCRITAYATMPG
jgi:hypothetical protein